MRRIHEASPRVTSRRMLAIAAVIAASVAAGIGMTAPRQGSAQPRISEAPAPAAPPTAAPPSAALTPVPPSSPGAGMGDSLRLDAFDKSYPPGETPPDWKATKVAPLIGDGDRYFYEFVDKGPNEHYLHLSSGRNNSFAVGSTVPVDAKERPWLEWEWKIAILPTGGDVRRKDRDDQAGAMCLVVKPTTFSFDSSLCYLFENDGPKDTPITSTKRDNARYLIVRTAKSGDAVGKWLHERRNLAEDYKRVFGREPAKPAYIGVQIDSDDTASSAEAFYRDLKLSKS